MEKFIPQSLSKEDIQPLLDLGFEKGQKFKLTFIDDDGNEKTIEATVDGLELHPQKVSKWGGIHMVSLQGESVRTTHTINGVLSHDGKWILDPDGDYLELEKLES